MFHLYRYIVINRDLLKMSYPGKSENDERQELSHAHETNSSSLTATTGDATFFMQSVLAR